MNVFINLLGHLELVLLHGQGHGVLVLLQLQHGGLKGWLETDTLPCPYLPPAPVWSAPASQPRTQPSFSCPRLSPPACRAAPGSLSVS